MFPISWNSLFRKKDGAIVKMEDAMSGGGGGYTLPTASADTKGGVKIGSGLSMDGEVLSVSGGGGGSIEYRAGEIAEFKASANNTFFKSVAFSSPMPNTNYVAIVSMLRGGTNPGLNVAIPPLIIGDKTVNGFNIYGYNNQGEAINFIKLEWLAIANN